MFLSRWVQFCQLPYLPEMKAMDDNLKFLDDVYTHLKVEADGQDILAAYKYAFSRRGKLRSYKNLVCFGVNALVFCTKRSQKLDSECPYVRTISR